MTTDTIGGLIAAARQHIENLPPATVQDEQRTGDVVLVDLREPEERATNGFIPGSMHAPRGMLEFYADSTSPYHRPEFDTDRRVILYCASGGRSALGAASLQQLGFANIAHLDGGFTAWKAAGLPVESL